MPSIVKLLFSRNSPVSDGGVRQGAVAHTQENKHGIHAVCYVGLVFPLSQIY